MEGLDKSLGVSLLHTHYINGIEIFLRTAHCAVPGSGTKQFTFTPSVL